MSLQLTLLSPERRLLEGVPVEQVTLTGSEGQVQILPGHVPFIGSIETGTFTYVNTQGDEVTGFISTGFFDVKDDKVNILAEVLELKNEIDLDRAKLAQKKAEEALKDATLEDSDFKKQQLKLQRALIRQQLTGTA